MEPSVIILGAAVLQWIVIVAISFFAARRVPKNLIVSTLILAVAFVAAFGVRRESAAFKAAALPPHSEGTASCASVEIGMSVEVVRTKLGKPQEVRDDAKTRGPGAATWVYRDSRCAVHVLDEKVQLID